MCAIPLTLGTVTVATRMIGVVPRTAGVTDGPLLTKCCLLEHHIEVGDGQAVVPWGASLAQIGDALAALAIAWEPTWAHA